MNTIVALCISGVSLGAVYGLLSLGFVIVFKATEVLNFAHAGFVMVGAYVAWTAGQNAGLPFLLAVACGLAAAALVAVVVDRLVSRSLAARSLVGASIATLGIDIVLQTEIGRRIGSRVLDLHDPWGSRVHHFGDVVVPESRLAAIGVSAVIIAALFAWFKFTGWGTAVRAATEDRETAALMGVPLRRVSAFAWLLAGALAAVAGVFLTAFPTPGLDSSTATVAFRALPAALIGGLHSTGGAVAGGVLVGVVEALAQGYQEDLSFLGDGFYRLVPYLLMMVVLLFRPAGLFGAREVTRV